LRRCRKAGSRWSAGVIAIARKIRSSPIAASLASVGRIPEAAGGRWSLRLATLELPSAANVEARLRVSLRGSGPKGRGDPLRRLASIETVRGALSRASGRGSARLVLGRNGEDREGALPSPSEDCASSPRCRGRRKGRHHVGKSHTASRWNFSEKSYLDRTGELGDGAAASRFLSDTIETMIRRGQRSRLALSNRAIAAYQHHRLSGEGVRGPAACSSP
jgi:hypothetical protein